jgi:cytochrome c oxidase accessory protein FixG
MDHIGALYEEEKKNEEFRDHLATVDEKGKRIWLYPKKPKGRFTNWRGLVSVVLLAILLGSPFVKIGGEPLLLFNIFTRKFVLFGQVFWPQDFHLFAIALITIVIFVALFTVVFGRIFCGWICPQTIFMEFVFRKVEFWIEGDYMAKKKLDKQPVNAEKIIKKGSKHLVFLFISALIMHTFMSYIVGVDRVWEIVQQPPSENMSGFIAMILLTGLFYGVFSRLREQVCTTICPYGRLQGVLLDQNSVVVAYDYKRGEQRSKFRKGEDRTALDKGDCIDCKQCVYVCPTGIDIRNGTQLDCVNCTACIDACDDIMDKIDKPRGLIRYASEETISKGTPFHFTKRMTAYSLVLFALIGVLTSLMIIRSDVETTIMRTPGIMYQERPDGRISNLYNIKLINKSNRTIPLRLQVLNAEGRHIDIEWVGGQEIVNPQEAFSGAFFIIFDENDIHALSTKLDIGVYDDQEMLETVKTKFLGPN